MSAQLAYRVTPEYKWLLKKKKKSIVLRPVLFDIGHGRPFERHALSAYMGFQAGRARVRYVSKLRPAWMIHGL